MKEGAFAGIRTRFYYGYLSTESLDRVLLFPHIPRAGFMSPFVISSAIVDDLEVASCPLKRNSRSQAVGTETAKALRTLSWMPHSNLDRLRVHTFEGSGDGP
jgi:hypothetical protein